MSPTLLSRVVVVLFEPQDHVNIGATVRAMRNMGVERLRLVRREVDGARCGGAGPTSASSSSQSR